MGKCKKQLEEEERWKRIKEKEYEYDYGGCYEGFWKRKWSWKEEMEYWKKVWGI